MRKRIMAAILAAMMVLCLLPTAAMANTEGESAPDVATPTSTVTLDGETQARLRAAGIDPEDYLWAVGSQQSELSLADQAKYMDIMARYNASAPVASGTQAFAAASAPVVFAMGGTAADPFLISDASQLAELAEYVNAGNATYIAAHYKMVGDVDLSGYREGAGFTPIGTLTHPFAGVFDGQNKRVEGLVINDDTAQYQGLFGCVNGASASAKAQIKDVTVVNASIVGGYYVGAVAGHYGDDREPNTEPMSGCAMEGGSVTGYGMVGGVVGEAYGSVTGCYATGSVKGSHNGRDNRYYGGVAGFAPNITGCYATGDVTAIHRVGGVAGGTSNMTNCYATGDVTGTGDYIGGVAGYASAREAPGSVTNCYATGNVISTGYNWTGGVVGGSDRNVSNCAALGREVRGGDQVGRVAGAVDTASHSFGWSGMTVTGVAGISTIDGTDLTYTAANAAGNRLSAQFEDIFANDAAWDYENDKLPTLKNVGGVQSDELPSWITDPGVTFIYTAADLKALADAVNASGATAEERGSGKIYKLANDINISGYSNWTPIGTMTNPFAGVFDGQGFTVKGLKINASANNQGLFGYVEGEGPDIKAQIKNVTVADADVTVTGGYAHVGAVVGYYGDYTETLTGCAMEGGSVSGGGRVGGVVGNANGVTNCHSTGSVSGIGDVGGVAGVANDVTEFCHASGSVTGTGSQVGGVVGHAVGRVIDCYATGNVKGGGDRVGGVAGYAVGSVTNCYAAGNVTGSSTDVGGVVGYADGSVTNCYATGNVKGGENVGGVAGHAVDSVTNCYASGNVTGIPSGANSGDYVGGVVGTADDSVEYCAALGRAVSGGSSVGRVAGVDSGTLSDLYAWDGMTATEGGTPVTVTGFVDTSKHGANLVYSPLIDLGNRLTPQIGLIFDDASAWVYGADKLPTLKDAGGTQSDALPHWMTKDPTDVAIYIYDGADLKALADAVNGGATAEDRGYGKIYRLANDIDLSEYQAGTGWTPIGNSTTPFAGGFDGQGYTVTGLRIANSGADYQGLFGYVKGEDSGNRAYVTNIAVKDAAVAGGSYIGAVVGYYGSNVDSLSGCAVLGGSVSGSYSIGGVAGSVGADASIVNCYSTCDVSGVSEVGGVVGYVVGYVDTRDSLYYCYSAGNVTGTGSNVGGVVGQTSQSVTNCVALGRAVSGARSVGRVAGSGTVSGCYAWEGMTVTEGGTAQTVTPGANTVQGGDLSYDGTLAAGSRLSAQFEDIFVFDAWDYADDKLPTLRELKGAQSDELPLWISEPNTTFIYTAAELKALADAVNASGATAAQRGSDKIYKLANDIDLSAYQAGTGWTPIGGKDLGSYTYSYFSGVFDGQGYEITGLVIDNPSVDYQGLFGRVRGEDAAHKAQGKNVTVVDASIVGKSYVAAVAGAVHSNTEPITGCAAEGGSVTGNYVGGVTGYCVSGATDCYSTAEVIGTPDASDSVGGVAGEVTRGDVISCYATGDVTGNGNYIGGVVGSADQNVTDCYATGNVTGTESVWVGGVVGQARGSVTGCHATGNVNGMYSLIGGVVGKAWSSVTDCYATGSVSGGEDYVGGVVGGWETNDVEPNSITNCYATGSVSGGGNYVGGVVGGWETDGVETGSITNCYATGDVTGGGDCVGGVVGLARVGVTNCYATGGVTGGAFVGGVVGQGRDSGSVTSCYATGDVSGRGNDVGGVVGQTSQSVTNCVALGRAVSGANLVGRVAGECSGTLSGLYAWSGMTVQVGSDPAAYITNGAVNNINGADITASDGLLYTATGAFGWQGFEAAADAHENIPSGAWQHFGADSSTVWLLRNTVKSKLPKLMGTPDDPAMNLVQQVADATEYTVTLTNPDGTDNVDAPLGGALPSVTPPIRSGYSFAGYFDAETGGTKYYNADGTAAKTWDKAANVTLYAQWTQNAATTYTLSLSASPAAGGSVAGGGSYTAGSRTVTATPNANYVFVEWQENGTRVSASASYTFTLSGNRALTAVFRQAGSPAPVDNDNNDDNPKTGDGALPGLWGALLLLSAAGMTAALIRRRKER